MAADGDDPSVEDLVLRRWLEIVSPLFRRWRSLLAPLMQVGCGVRFWVAVQGRVLNNFGVEFCGGGAGDFSSDVATVVLATGAVGGLCFYVVG